MNYMLKDGREIEDEVLSALMERLVELRPHQSQVYTWDQQGMATLVSDLYEDEIRYCPQNGRWYLWEGCWRKQPDDGMIIDRIQTVLNLLRLYIGEAKDDGNAEMMEKYDVFLTKLRNCGPQEGVLKMLKPMLRMYLPDMDNNPYLLNTPRAAYDLRTGKIVEDIAPFNVTKKTSCNLPDFKDVRCDRWYQFIDEIMSGNREKAAFLQRAIGYSILGVNREEAMFIAYGSSTRNGKGTLFSTICTVLGEDYADSAPTMMICEGKNGKTVDFNAPQPALAKLVGTRLVTMAESAKDIRLDAASVKTMTGRDSMVTRDLFESAFSFVPQFTLWLNTNHLPAVTDDTVFSSNRVHVIEFSEHFEGSNQNKDLKEIFANPENRPTILKWIVDGCEDYMRHGLNPPECVLEATANYRKMHDRTGNFLEEVCVEGADKSVPRGILYAAYRAWCTKAENRYTPMGSTCFYNEMAIRGFPPHRRSDGWYTMGLELKGIEKDGRISLT